MVGRDSLFGERIVWEGRPTRMRATRWQRAIAAGLFVTSLISVCFAVALALGLGVAPTGPLVLGAWTATLGLALLHGPRLWFAKVRYLITERHVVWQRGRLRRSIDRDAINFARIFWDDDGGVGDIELVRAVPTGALRRRLTLRLSGVSAPDRVWALVRGVPTVVPSDGRQRPLTQRLDANERVVWTSRPKPSWRGYLPRTRRQWSLLLIAAMMTAVAGRMVVTALNSASNMVDAGLTYPTIATLVIAQALALLLVIAVGASCFHTATTQPGRAQRFTRYLVTNRRVLIQRGREELHLDRNHIIDTIDMQRSDGNTTLFLVLDGPQARAVAASGAFGEPAEGPFLRPVLAGLSDATQVSAILAAPSSLAA